MAAKRDDPDRKMFGNLVKKLREQRNWSREELAVMIGHTASTIVNIETGYRAPTPAQAESLDRAFGLPETLTDIEERLRGLPFSAGFRPFTPYEAEATVMWFFGITIIPGLLQTADYAREILARHPDVTPELVDERLDGRMKRQKILDKPDPPKLRVMLDQGVLHRAIGGPKVMAAQLRHLASLARRPGITIQIVAETTHSGLTGAFVVAETPDRRVAYLETAVDGETTEDPGVVAELDVRFDNLRSEALRGSESMALIERVIDGYEQSDVA